MEIKFTEEERLLQARAIQGYFRENLDREIGRFEAEALLDFFSKRLGAYFYNRALYDSQKILSRKVDDLKDLIDQLEQPTEFKK